MTSWLDPVRSALDDSDDPVRFFFRDDDAGWDDDALERLLDVFEPHGLPLDVAAIPTAVTPRTVQLVTGGRVSGRRDVTVHQHGYAHVNHELVGRKCEFGVSRPPEQQAEDIAAGRALLRERVGDVPAVFTPPWNRCAPWTPAVLRQLGFAVLSRDVSAGRAGLAGLVELPVSVDWFAKRKGIPVDRAGRGELLAASVREPGPVGVMLHHAVMAGEDLADLGALLGLVSEHQSASAAHLDEIALARA